MKLFFSNILIFYFIVNVSHGNTFEPLGCYRDNWERDLNSSFNFSHKMTIEHCISICFKYNKPFAGLQYSSQCFCGNTFGKYGSANCTMKCRGNSSQICGDGLANSIYKIQFLKCDSFELSLGDIFLCSIEFYKSEIIGKKVYLINIDFGDGKIQNITNNSNIINFNYTYMTIGRFDIKINEFSLNFVYSTKVNITGIVLKPCPSKVIQYKIFTLEIVRWNFDKDVLVNFSDSYSQTLNKSKKYIHKAIDDIGNYSVAISDSSKVYYKCTQIQVIPWLINYSEIFELLKLNKFDLNDCLSNCSGNGFCKLSTKNVFICECFQNSTGKLCQINKNICSINQCMNNGTCIAKNNNTLDFECECVEPFYGKRCEFFRNDFCEKKYNCKSSKNCFLIIENEPKCKCVNLMEGSDCSIESDQLKRIKIVRKNSWIISLIFIASIYLIFISIDVWNIFIQKEEKQQKKKVKAIKFKYIS